MDITSLRERRDLNALTVTELNTMVKSILDNASVLQRIYVRGELSNVNLHSSGHIYFTLKDSDCQIKCIMFRSSASSLRFTPKEGMRVILNGTVSAYTKGGTYQIYASSMHPDGVGDLYLAYCELKAKLEGEGLFLDSHKNQIPKYPTKIGVITSPTGAAVRDIIHVTQRRFPMARIYLYPSLVQGDGAVENLLEALDYFEKSKLCDVVIIGRGGGSIEDLWAFNSEKIARKIYEMTVPVISAVGHETDFTICDFVSDMRAPTPSAAAEIATPDWESVLYYQDELSERMRRAVIAKLESLTNKYEALSERPVLKRADGWLMAHEKRYSEADVAFKRAASSFVEKEEGKFALLLAKLDALSPLSVLRRGYSITKGEDGVPIRARREVSVGDTISIRLSDGEIKAKVTES